MARSCIQVNWRAIWMCLLISKKRDVFVSEGKDWTYALLLWLKLLLLKNKIGLPKSPLQQKQNRKKKKKNNNKTIKYWSIHGSLLIYAEIW